jgi:hypothetical protein
MSIFHIFCESCGADYSLDIFFDGQKRQPKFCTCCGAEIDPSSIAEEESDKIKDDWNESDDDLFTEDWRDDWR